MGPATKLRIVKELHGRKKLYSALKPGNFRRLSRLTGIAVPHISRVLRGKASCSFDAACLIAGAAGVTLDDFRAHVACMRSYEKFPHKAGPDDPVADIEINEDEDEATV